MLRTLLRTVTTRSVRIGRFRWIASLIALGACVLIGETAVTEVPAAASSPGAFGDCVPVRVPGVLHGDVEGTLCHAGDADSAPLQVLVPGATYDRWYWDGEGVPAASYTAVATRAGYSTLAIDRLGTGESAHPVSTALTGAVAAAAIHQVITAARAGTLDGIRYGRVVLVGHSLGSLDSVIEASTYRDVAALVLTGYTHQVSVPAVAQAFQAAVRPAMLEGFVADPGYLTTAPGTREGLFDSPGDVDPAVVAADEAHKDTVSATELADGLAEGLNPVLSRRIDVPVLEVTGGRDQIFCGTLTSGCSSAAALYSTESPDFGGRLATLVDPDAGHDVALARDGGMAAAAMHAWLTSTLTGHLVTGPQTGIGT